MVIPGEPAGKGRPRFLRNGKTYTPKATRERERSIAAYAKLAMAGYPAVDHHELKVAITAFFGIPKSWARAKTERALDGSFRTAPQDVDNIAKAVLDGLNGVVWADDKQVVDLHVSKGYAREPKTVVRIEPVLEGGEKWLTWEQVPRNVTTLGPAD